MPSTSTDQEAKERRQSPRRSPRLSSRSPLKHVKDHTNISQQPLPQEKSRSTSSHRRPTTSQKPEGSQGDDLVKIDENGIPVDEEYRRSVRDRRGDADEAGHSPSAQRRKARRSSGRNKRVSFGGQTIKLFTHVEEQNTPDKSPSKLPRPLPVYRSSPIPAGAFDYNADDTVTMPSLQDVLAETDHLEQNAQTSFPSLPAPAQMPRNRPLFFDGEITTNLGSLKQFEHALNDADTLTLPATSQTRHSFPDETPTMTVTHNGGRRQSLASVDDVTLPRTTFMALIEEDEFEESFANRARATALIDSSFAGSGDDDSLTQRLPTLASLVDEEAQPPGSGQRTKDVSSHGTPRPASPARNTGAIVEAPSAECTNGIVIEPTTAFDQGRSELTPRRQIQSPSAVRRANLADSIRKLRRPALLSEDSQIPGRHSAGELGSAVKQTANRESKEKEVVEEPPKIRLEDLLSRLELSFVPAEQAIPPANNSAEESGLEVTGDAYASGLSVKLRGEISRLSTESRCILDSNTISLPSELLAAAAHDKGQGHMFLMTLKKLKKFCEVEAKKSLWNIQAAVDRQSKASLDKEAEEFEKTTELLQRNAAMLEQVAKDASSDCLSLPRPSATIPGISTDPSQVRSLLISSLESVEELERSIRETTELLGGLSTREQKAALELQEMQTEVEALSRFVTGITETQDYVRESIEANVLLSSLSGFECTKASETVLSFTVLETFELTAKIGSNEIEKVTVSPLSGQGGSFSLQRFCEASDLEMIRSWIEAKLSNCLDLRTFTHARLPSMLTVLSNLEKVHEEMHLAIEVRGGKLKVRLLDDGALFLEARLRCSSVGKLRKFFYKLGVRLDDSGVGKREVLSVEGVIGECPDLGQLRALVESASEQDLEQLCQNISKL